MNYKKLARNLFMLPCRLLISEIYRRRIASLENEENFYIRQWEVAPRLSEFASQQAQETRVKLAAVRLWES